MRKSKLVLLIKAIQSFERLGTDFKGPKSSTSHNRYILTITDEHSCFLLTFACSDTQSSTVIGRLSQLFTIFDMPSYMHFDRGTSSMSAELFGYRKDNGVALSHITSYSPQEVGQFGCLNNILWRAISLALRFRGLPLSQ